MTASAGTGEDMPFDPDVDTERMWLNVVRKMDETWAELLTQQAELERKNNELEETQAFMAGVLDSMSDLLMACDRQLTIVRTNIAAERLFAVSGRRLAGMTLETLIAPASPGTIQDLRAVIAQKTRLEDQEYIFESPQGDLPFAVNGSLRFDPRGRVTGLVLVARPVGELRKAYRDLAATHRSLQDTQAQLVQAEKMASLGRLVAGVAHELNNPISFVYGNAHTLHRYARRLAAYLDALHALPASPQLAEQRQTLRIDMIMTELEGVLAGIVDGAERVRDIVADLRRFSSDRRDGRAPFDLEPVATTALGWVLAAAPPGIVLELQIEGPLDVFGHSGQIHQVVMNLVQNAVDAMEALPEGAKRSLEISGGRREDHAWLAVRDTGPGIAPDVMERMFDPFFTTKPVGKGTGLGLAISYRILQEHGGTLMAANHPEGGAIMTIELPAQLLDQGEGPLMKS
ncbi:sensor histidine kinase [Beijerinckia indica]|uniref:histidine kinase n=1 Tax=Beijerinckia indica subsp. indica (strain ATCC 9039 / DSM 1715 / NCIMB 8712) TaxID=395963 RepID=B2IJ24_BEII9|nr:ATP-binding protein [Beijerinckia indica]ACB94787.1 PAS/PAC sensor signal transduction histidine kinase [Beijerinckia indica subsp. indica ATCC 9039]